MENKLFKLFDFQKYENNDRLAKLINESEDRLNEALSDDELEFLAAGANQYNQKNEEIESGQENLGSPRIL